MIKIDGFHISLVAVIIIILALWYLKRTGKI